MPMKNCPFVDDWFAIPTSKYSHGEPSVAMFKNRGVAMSLGAWPAPQKEPSIQSCNGPTPMINAHFKPSLGVLWMTHFWNFAFSRCSPKKLSKYGKCQKKTMVHQRSIHQSSKLWAAACSFYSTRNLSSTAVIFSVSLAQPQL